MFMDNKKDPMEQIILEDILREAEVIDEEVLKDGTKPMPDNLKEKIKKNIYAQVEEIEKERLYAQLSEEDRKALELGREILKKADTPDEGKVVRCRKRLKVYLAVAAVAVLVFAMGITSIGGAERVIEIVKLAIGDREIVRVETGEDNYIDTSEDEEIAYQRIRDVFGVEAVKPIEWPKGTIFIEAEIDEKLQTAALIYEYNKNSINYYISSHYTLSSWGIDVENETTDSYYIELQEMRIEAKEYKTPESEEKMYSAKFSYKGLDYFLIGSIEKEQFDYIIKNLVFF